MIQILKYYFTQKEAFPRLFYLLLVVSTLTFVMSDTFEPDAILSLLFMLNMYFFIFTQPYIKNEVNILGRELPLSHAKLWIAKLLVFYTFMFFLNAIGVCYKMYEGQTASEAITETLEWHTFVYMVMFLLGRWAIFKYRNPSYLIASIAGMFLLIASNVLVTSEVHFDANNHLLQVVLSVGFMFLISLIDYLLDRLKNKQDMD